MAEVTVKGAKQIEKDLQVLSKFMPIPKKDLNAMAELWKNAIKDRTLAGKDAENKPFARYSQRYRKFRIKSGRDVSKVNLTFHGHMLAAMTHHATKNQVRILFRSMKEGLKAHGHHYGSSKTGLPPRPFFDLNDGDLEEAVRYLERQHGIKL